MNNKENIYHFNLIERIQHIILFVSLTMLTFTGLSLLYYDTWFGRFMMQIEGGYQNRGMLHHIFAFVLISVSIFQAFYVTFSDKGHKDVFNIKFFKKDFKNFTFHIKYIFGIIKEVPGNTGYTFAKKFHYWLVVCICAAMIVTGLVLFSRVSGLGMFIPKWLWDITILIHSKIAIINLLTLFLWHIYNVHFGLNVYHMKWDWLTRIFSKEKMQTDAAKVCTEQLLNTEKKS